MRKIFTTLLLVFSLSICKAQWVTIPDTNFAAWLQAAYPTCMNGNQMDTTCGSIIGATYLYIGSGISDLTGVQYFDSLTNLTIYGAAVNYIPPLPGMLTQLHCSNCNLTSLPVMPNSLSILACDHNDFTSLPLLPSGLTQLFCMSNQLTSLPNLPASLSKLYCDYNLLTSLPSLPSSLTKLYCNGNHLSSLPSLPNSLTTIECTNNILSSFPVLPLSLKYLDCRDNHIPNFFSLPNSMEELRCQTNLLTTLPVLSDSLTYLDCSDNNLTSLPNLPNILQTLLCWSNQINGLPVLPNSLTTIDCSGNLISSIPTIPSNMDFFDCSMNPIYNLPALPNSITNLWCIGDHLTSIPILPLNLKTLMCYGNYLTTLPSFPDSLTNLECFSNNLTSLPSLPAGLRVLECYDNQLTSLPDLPATMDAFEINDNPNLMCMPPLFHYTGDNNFFDISNTGITCLPNLIQHSGYRPAIDTMPICDIFNTNGCAVGWNIMGSTLFDADGICVSLNDVTPIPHLKMNLKDSAGNLLEQIIASWNGQYSFDTQLGTYKTSLDTFEIPFIVVCPASNNRNHNLTVTDSMDFNMDFRMICKPGFDIGVWDVVDSWMGFFPGETSSVHIVAGDAVQNIYNVSCSSGISGAVKVLMSGPINYQAPVLGALTPLQNGDTLIYSILDFSLINPVTDFRFYVGTDTSAQIGDEVCFDVTVTPTTGDNNISNNILTHCFEVSNSYDPNEKEVSPIGSLPNQFNDWLTYTIHFQNTGTAAAQHIQILDTLDSDLNASTFQLLSYSHAPLVQLFGSKVHFNFVNINLPDSTTDFEGSKGYVSYRVKPLDNLPSGTTIENTASIYFDFNTPVITNTVSNAICNPIAPTNLSETICEGDSYNFNGINILTAGNYSVTINSINGCDSIVNLNLTVDTVNTGIALTENAASSQAVGAIYQWLDCNNNYSLIPGATNQNYITEGAETVAVMVTQNGCTDTSNCIFIDGISQLTVDNLQFSVFPNPTDENINVTLSHPDSYRGENCRIEISNTLGQIVFEQSMNQQSVICNLKLLSSGIYFITLRSDKMSMVKKLVKD